MAHCPSCELLHTARGHALKQLLDKTEWGSPAAMMLTDPTAAPPEAEDLLSQLAVGRGSVKLYGSSASLDCLGPFMLGLDNKCAELMDKMSGQVVDPEGLLEAEPLRLAPTMKDGDYALAGSAVILRYLAQKFAPRFYLPDPAIRARIDWACDCFAFNGLYEAAVATIHPCLGFGELREDIGALGSALKGRLQQFADVFLRDRFVGGDSPCIADYRVAPFFFAWGHPTLRARCSIIVPERITKFNADFAAASPHGRMLSDASGWALKEALDRNRGQP